ncbi:hypothetical protein [Thalassotalea sp. ND16A]|uniref:hypothetical protein n=1 Tax=Thalassotalea sp. ND16A TaxID=1535422 RepID=UPI00051A82C3|nr:hypothetical protein [Thalassotalea sp. ND16A]KGK00170.1 hypothetical protein ND16A_3641 [Thalassotalea sp. ND16A]
MSSLFFKKVRGIIIKKPNHRGKVLKDHKKVGKKLIPPMKQIASMQETSFVDELLPCVVWMSALYLRCDGRLATKVIIEFITDAEAIFGENRPQPLYAMGNFSLLSCEQKKSIYDAVKGKSYFEMLLESLEHQHHILKDYPLSFLFEEHMYAVDKVEAIAMLSEDVKTLLDRHSSIATKVQVTAFYSTLETGRLKVCNPVKIPDFNTIFTKPDSDEAKHAAAFARAHMNGSIGMFRQDNDELNIKAHTWVKDFWMQTFNLSDCISEY